MEWLDYLLMAVFLSALVIIGGIFSRSSGNTSEHLLAGSKIPWWAVAISYIMALFSTVSFVATPGEAYNNGLRLYVFEWFAPITGLTFFFLFMRFYFTAKVFTPFAYLESRFDGRIRAIISSIYFLTRIFFLALVLLACAKVFKGMAEWPVWLTILLLGSISTAYCVMGGFKAVIWTNVLQFFVMVGGIAITLTVCLNNIEGGAKEVIQYSFANNHGFNFDKEFFSIDPHVRLSFWWFAIGSISAYMFYNCADQIAIQQLLASKSYEQARKSFISTLIIFVPLGAVLWFIGLAVYTYYGQHPAPEGNPPGDLALFRFIILKMPAPFPGLIASSMLAAAISTVGAMMMSLATVATKDFYLRFFNPKASEQRQMYISRLTTLILGISGTTVGVLISITSKTLGETLIEASTIWVAISTIIAPVFFIGVVNPKCNVVHALVSIVVGTVATLIMVIWYLVSRQMGNPISFMLIQVPGFILSIIVGLVLPFFIGQPPTAEKIANLTIWTRTKK